MHYLGPMHRHGYQDLLRSLNELDWDLFGDEPLLNAAERAAAFRKREELATALPTALLHHHDELVRQGRESLAALRPDGCCSVCETRLPAASLADLSEPGTIGVCPECGVFVFKPLGEAGAAAS